MSQFSNQLKILFNFLVLILFFHDLFEFCEKFRKFLAFLAFYRKWYTIISICNTLYIVLKIPDFTLLRQYCNRHFTLKCQNEIKIPFDSFSMHEPPAAVNFVSTYFPSWFWIIWFVLKIKMRNLCKYCLRML